MIDEYTKKTKKEDEDCQNFLGLNKKEEEKIKKNIENCYKNIITNYIKEKITNNKNINTNVINLDKLIEFITIIIDNLSPSFRDLKDSMNINDYIKVKLINYNDFTKSKVIDGFALTKNVCSKKMGEKQETPKILFLDLDLNDHEANEPTKIKKESIKEESFKIDEIQKKIKLLGVNIILLNKGINNLLLQSLLKDSKLIIIINVKSSSLKKIARCTKGEVITSLLELDIGNQKTEEDKNNKKQKLSSNILGTCKLFQIENTNNFMKKKIKDKKYIINDFTSNNIQNFNNIILSNNYKLMIFEGCNDILFKTLLLSGNDRKSLKEVKKLLKNEIFSTSREFFLQKNMLYFLFCNIPSSINNINNEEIKTDNKVKGDLLLSRGISNDMKKKYDLLSKN